MSMCALLCMRAWLPVYLIVPLRTCECVCICVCMYIYEWVSLAYSVLYHRSCLSIGLQKQSNTQTKTTLLWIFCCVYLLLFLVPISFLLLLSCRFFHCFFFFSFRFCSFSHIWILLIEATNGISTKIHSFVCCHIASYETMTNNPKCMQALRESVARKKR